MQEELEKKIVELENKLEGFKKPLNIFSINVPAKNKVDKALKFLTVYAEVTNSRLVPLDIKILAYYILKGLTDETLEMIIEDDPRYEVKKENKPFTINHLHGINKRLRDQGYLIKSKTNEQKFHLSQEMENLAKKINKDQCKGILISL
jgi:hypothetical protein